MNMSGKQCKRESSMNVKRVCGYVREYVFKRKYCVWGDD